jgi:G2/mitotic-specific cyclin-B, other
MIRKALLFSLPYKISAHHRFLTHGYWIASSIHTLALTRSPTKMLAVSTKRKREGEAQVEQGLSLPTPTVAWRKAPFTKKTDPRLCLDRLDDMFQSYYEQEQQFAPKHGYMEGQKEINNKMRAILVDWLVEVHHKFKNQTSTLWLCINIMDRYLEAESVLRSQLQLVGVTALLISCKFEEIYPPEVKDCVYITDYAYTKEDVLRMEATVLKRLNFEICIPTGYHFLSRYLEVMNASDRTRILANFYAERNMQEYDMLRFKPHVYAASALLLALKQQAQHAPPSNSSSSPYPYSGGSVGDTDTAHWPLILQEESGLMATDLLSCARVLIKHLKEEPETASKRRLNAVRKKYSTEKYHSVSSLPLPSI